MAFTERQKVTLCLSMKAIRKSQTQNRPSKGPKRPPFEFGANPFSGSRNISFTNKKLGIQRVPACIHKHFAFALQHPRSMDEMERCMQAGRFYRRRGESSPACVVCLCGMRTACGGPGGLPLGSATHFHSVAIATQPVH